jgi:hypothetical protein
VTGDARTHRHRGHEAEHVPAFASYRVTGEFLDEVLLGLLVQDRKPEPKGWAGPRVTARELGSSGGGHGGNRRAATACPGRRP